MAHHIKNALKALVLPASTKTVLIEIADRANLDGWCWATAADLGRATNLSRSTVFRALARLRSAGLIERPSPEPSAVGFRVRVPRAYATDKVPHFVILGQPLTQTHPKRKTAYK